MTHPMTTVLIECAAASCPEEVRVGTEPTRCPGCGTRYHETTVLSSPLPTVDPGDEARRLGPAPEADAPDGVDADATTAGGQLDINLNLNVDGA